MNSVKKYHELSTSWVNMWIGIGIGAIIFFVVCLLLLGVLISMETIRMHECEAGMRLDCERSLIWTLQGFSLKEQLGDIVDQEALKKEADEKLKLAYNHGIRYYQTSGRAPRVAGVELRGTDYDADWFSADAGTEIEIIIRPEGVFERGAIFENPRITTTPGIGMYVDEMNEQPDGTFVGSYTIPEGLEADLEIRIISAEGEYGSAFIQLRSRSFQEN